MDDCNSMTSGTPALLRALLPLAALLAAGVALRAQADAAAEAPPLPTHLRGTGLYADPARAGWRSPVAPGLVEFVPQYPLWTDGAAKRRWLRLPPGTAIDAADPAAWQFPPGTRLWKQFGYARPVETRMIERLADGSWRYASYAWNAEGTDAVLVPEAGARVAVRDAPVASYAIPSVADCKGCHEGAAVPPLGVGALQLAPRLAALSAAGVLRNVPAAQLDSPPRIAAASPDARAALGYLHANCGHCHNRGPGRVPVALSLAQEWNADGVSTQAALDTAIDRMGRTRLRAHPDARLVAPGDPAASSLALRMESHDPLVRMPPVGTQVVDEVGVALVKRWIAELQPSHKEPTP